MAAKTVVTIGDTPLNEQFRHKLYAEVERNYRFCKLIVTYTLRNIRLKLHFYGRNLSPLHKQILHIFIDLVLLLSLINDNFS